MQADEVERWKQRIRNSSIGVLKDIHKLLTYSVDKDTEKMSAIYKSIVVDVNELIAAVKRQLNSATGTGRKALREIEESERRITSIVRSSMALVSSSNYQARQELRNQFKALANGIKDINQFVEGLKLSDIAPIESELGRPNEDLKSLAESTTEAINALQQLEKAVKTRNQELLVSYAKVLSIKCGELLTVACRQNLTNIANTVKSLVLQVISNAKLSFQSDQVGDVNVESMTNVSIQRTIEALNRLLSEFESGSGAATVEKQEAPLPRRGSSSGMGIEAQDPIGEVLAKVGGTGEKSIEESQTRDESIKQLEKEFASRDPEKVFKIQGELGKETGSHVYRAIHRETKKVVAIKKMTVAGANIVAMLKEIYTMKELKSEYTLKYYGCYHKNNCIWVVMQYCDGGSVQDIIDARENEDICFTERQIAEIVTQVLKALEYLHSLKKIHRDVKAANILLSSDGTVKLTDFSLSAQQIGDEKRTTTIGSCYWMAPETLMGSGYDSKADIWSLGITVLEMAEGIPPLIEEKPHRAVFRIVNDPPPKLYCPSAWSNEFNDFISRCLVKNPEYRPTSTELLKHPFVVNAKNGRQSIIELVQCNQKGLKKEKGLHVEEEVELSIWINDVEKKLVIPSHATSEDVCRQFSTSHDLDQNSCQLWVVIKDLNKTKEKKLGPYERPAKVSSDLRKKLKLEKKGPSNNRASYRFVLKEGNRIKTKK